MNIALTGASGMLGTALIDSFKSEINVFATAREKGLDNINVSWKCFDITDSEELEAWLNYINPDVIIHCAALVNVDECEINQDLAYELHVRSTQIIANHCALKNSHLIYISTDSVFDGTDQKPYSESDPTFPINVYSHTKLLGEQPVLLLKKGTVLRTNIVGWSLKDRLSFSEWVIKNTLLRQQIKLFNDVFFSPINVTELSEIIITIIKMKAYGLFHISSMDQISKYEFGVQVASIFDCPSKYFAKISVDDIGLKAKRPKNVSLSNKKITNLLGKNFSLASNSIVIMRNQYLNGYVARIKNIDVNENFEFWKK